MLDRLYTDITADVSPIRHMASFCPNALLPEPVKRLLSRHLPTEIPRDRVRSMPLSALLCWLTRRHPGAPMSRRILRDGFGIANAIYLLSDCDPSIAVKAKKGGLRVVYEQIGSPDDPWIVRQERELFPGIEELASPEEEERDNREERSMWEAADRILVPSEFVYSGVVARGVHAAKLRLVPYGIPNHWLSTTTAPVRGRILFVGDVSLRKGSHYLAGATRMLRSRGLKYEVRVVGPVKSRISKSPLFYGPTYLGAVPRSEVHREFLTADLFVLPTLSDSFALAHLEALACGVPVITTPNCGSVVRDGIDGFIVPIRNENALADKIELLLTDPRLRNEMSHNARERAKEYTWERYGEKLLTALRS